MTLSKIFSGGQTGVDRGALDTALVQKSEPLNQPDQATFYTPGPKGYTDNPTLEG